LFSNPGEDAIRALLSQARRIAVVGLSPKPHRDSHRVARYLIGRGYDVVPIYPREDEILGHKVYRRLQDVPGKLDLVDVFRRSEFLSLVVDDLLAKGGQAIWFQLGCVDESAAGRAQEGGVQVVMDRCIMVDHALLLGRDWRASAARQE
jgi:uncharacterized protein